ncbi:expressed unknown protein [Seminavis robusta]|uniref:Uncharacterized protein n=1 Tax=Seminavis robusta TaxID=568900 RepID=A0A9N8H0H0_9STRA|nr:expressed unknown protein [Seminavis robusta]|eukprot:Sro20_g014310.1 n/a (176) ;mRNA; r:136636-137163
MGDHKKEFFKMFLVILVVIALSIFVVKNLPGRWIESKDGDFPQTFLAHVGKQKDWSFAVQETLSRMLTAWWDKKCGGIIIHNDKQYQVILFENGPFGPGKVDGIPMIKAKWVKAKDEAQARVLAQRYLRYEMISCTDETFDVLIKHLSVCPRNGQNVGANGAVEFQGFLSPVILK